MLILKKTMLVTSIVAALALVGCGGSSDNSSNNNNGNSSNPNTGGNGNSNNNSNGNNDSGNTSNLVTNQDLAIDNKLELFHVAEVIPSKDAPTDFAILYNGETQVAYQTKGFKWSDYQASAPAETYMVLTKNKIYEENVSEEIISHKAGQYTYGSKDAGGYSIVYDYKTANLEGKKILDDSFFMHSGLFMEQTFYSGLDLIYKKVESLINISKTKLDKFSKDSYCGIITHVEYKQPTIEFSVDEFSEAYTTIADWVNEKKDEKYQVTTDTFAGYKVAYAIDPNGINESEALVEYKGETYYASYSPQEKIDVEQQYVKSIKKINDLIKAEKDKDIVAGLKETLKNLEAQHVQFKNNSLCTMYNGTAAKSILNTLKKVESL